MNKIILALFCFFLLCGVGELDASVVFQDNFDSATAWANPCERSVIDVCGCSTDDCVDDEIENWDFWNVDEFWNPTADSDSSGAQININSTNARSGKSITFYNEAHVGRSFDGWGSDGVVMKILPSSYNELVVRMYIKYQPGYQFLKNGAAIKTLRVGHNGGVRPVNFSGSETKDNDPLYFYDLSYKTIGTYLYNFHTFRCSPASTDYMCNETEASTEYSMDVNDNTYHKYVYRFVENSAPGIHDGIFQMYVDDVLQYSRSNISYVRDGGSCSGFNMVAIGGNNNNSTDGEAVSATISDIRSGQLEQWYSIDDFSVFTSMNDLAPPTYDSPTITGPVDSSTTNTSVEIEGTYTIDPDLPDQSVIVTWTLGENTGFCIASLGIFSGTALGLNTGSNNVVLNVVDSNGGSAMYYITITRTSPPSGNVIYTGSMSGGSYR